MKHALSALLTLALCALSSSALAEQQVSVEYDALDLAKNEIPLSKAVFKDGKKGPIELSATGCKLSLVPSAIKKVDGGCDKLWNANPPPTLTLTATSPDLKEALQVILKPVATPDSLTLESKGPFALIPSAAPEGAELVLHHQGSWVHYESEKQGNRRGFDLGALPPGEYSGYTNFASTGAAGRFLAVVTVKAVAPSAPGMKPAPPSEHSPLGAKVTGVGPEFCTVDDKGPKYVVCIDLIQSTTQFRAVGTDASAQSFVSRQIMRPNAGLLVKVRHDAKSTVSMELGGERGIFVSKIVSQLPDGEANAAAAPPIRAVMTPRSFGPRLPGAADLTIVETDPAGEARTQKIELLVEETHAGALRLGIASVFGQAVDRSYAARQVGGSQQAEIVATSANDVDFELVLATAPYLFDYLFLDGPRPAISAGPRFAPYFGIGLVSVKPDEEADLAFLRSMYFGLELEFVQSFSVAGAAVIRKVTRLGANQKIGTATDADVLVESTTGIGFGLVVNFSPDFFKVASKGAGGVL